MEVLSSINTTFGISCHRKLFLNDSLEKKYEKLSCYTLLIWFMSCPLVECWKYANKLVQEKLNINLVDEKLNINGVLKHQLHCSMSL